MIDYKYQIHTVDISSIWLRFVKNNEWFEQRKSTTEKNYINIIISNIYENLETLIDCGRIYLVVSD